MTFINMELPRIALTGTLRSGKTSAAFHLTHNHGFASISFGSALKHYAEKLFANSDVYPTEYITRDCPFSADGKYTVGTRKPRKLYQDFGQAMRALDGDIWINHAEQSLALAEDSRGTAGVVIDDLRQPNEYEWAKRNGFVVIRVNADEGARIARAKALGDTFGADELAHDTEQHVDSFEVDYEITNDGDYVSLERQIDEIMGEIVSGRAGE